MTVVSAMNASVDISLAGGTESEEGTEAGFPALTEERRVSLSVNPGDWPGETVWLEGSGITVLGSDGEPISLPKYWTEGEQRGEISIRGDSRSSFLRDASLTLE